MASQPVAAEADPFASLPVASADQAWLRERTAAIKFVCRRALADLIQIGGFLAEAKARVGHGGFTAWVETCLPWDTRTAQKLMSVAATFPATPATVALLDIGAAYYLAQPSTPPGARAYALECAADGTRVTLAAAKEFVAAQRERITVAPREVKTLAPIDREHERVGQEAKDRNATLGAALVKLLAATTDDDVAVYLRVTVDETGLQSVAATYYPAADPRPKHCHAADLLVALQTLAGNAPAKTCARCCQTRPLNLFSRDALQGDGLNRYCKTCERKRYAECKRRRREFKAAQNPSAS